MPKSVLVADDSMTIRKVIGMLFATEDISLTAVDNGLDAINKARELRPDLVLADCMMPGKNGYEVCQALKADPSTAGIPVLLLSGTFEPFDANRAQAVGAAGNIQKPFDSTSFLDRVKTTVGLPAGSSPAPVTYAAAAPAAPAPIAAAPRAPQPLPGAGAPRPLGIPPAPVGAQPGLPPRPMGVPPGTQPGMAPRPMGVPAGTQPGMPPRPMGIPAGTQPGIPPRPLGAPGVPLGTQPGMPPRPMGVPGMPGVRAPSMQGMPAVGAPMPGGFRPPGAPMPGAVPGARRDPFGLPPQGAPVQQIQQQPRQPDLSLDSHQVGGDGGEAVLRDALSKASKEVIEKIAWEVVPQLAETIIRAELDRLIKDREAKGLA